MKGPADRQRLRGCIGTLQPRYIRQGLKDYALTSALRDHRFNAVQWSEVPSLECTVSLLTNYEDADHYLDWEVRPLSPRAAVALRTPTQPNSHPDPPIAADGDVGMVTTAGLH